jgi:hypothetical protein
MGISPAEADRCEPYQVMAVYRGWVAANSPKSVHAPSPDEFREAVRATVH